MMARVFICLWSTVIIPFAHAAPVSANNQLRDIQVPDAPLTLPSPLLSGLLIVLIAAAIIAAVARRWWLNQKSAAPKISNAFRQEALIELKSIPWDENHPAASLQAVNEVLKRVAITRYQRTDVSALTGDSWLDYLNDTGPKNRFDQPPLNALGHDCFNPDLQMKKANYRKILATAKQWIDHQ